MPNKIFDTGSLNVSGICHAICCKWIKASRQKGQVQSLLDLGSPMAMFMNWELPGNYKGINELYHLSIISVKKQPRLDGGWLAQQATTSSGYGLIVLWGGGLDVKSGSHVQNGHTVAVCKETGKVEYFDPNDGAYSFSNSMELYSWLPNELLTKYPELSNRECEYVKV